MQDASPASSLVIPQKEDRDGTDDYRSKYRSIEQTIHRLSRECLPYREEAGDIAMRWTMRDLP